MRCASHRFEEHTGELKIRVQADSIEELYAQAARALGEVFGDPLPASGAWLTVEVHARDRNALMVEWLNEVVFRSERERRIFTEVEVLDVTERRLLARLRGSAVREQRTQVKAATYHDLSVQPEGDGFVATVVLDV